jgi:LPS sulfotransferase NodH
MIDYQFDRPIILLASPRSGSTLLFETLKQSSNLWTIGGESHQVFEQFEAFDPSKGVCHSNRLLPSDADAATAALIRKAFFANLRNADGETFASGASNSGLLPRLLEKTPKNALRVGFLDRIFPDALFIYLYRDPRENLSSIIEAWRSERFVTYRNLPGWPGNWSLLLPPGYEQLRGASLAKIAATQWYAANAYIMQDLESIDAARWTSVSYEELVSDTEATILRLCNFAGLPFEGHLRERCLGTLPMSCHTLTAPQQEKWRNNEVAINSVIHELEPLIGRMEKFVVSKGSSRVVSSGPVGQQPESASRKVSGTARGLRRNDPCFCGTGRRFKHCHGALRSDAGTQSQVKIDEA